MFYVFVFILSICILKIHVLAWLEKPHSEVSVYKICCRLRCGVNLVGLACINEIKYGFLYGELSHSIQQMYHRYNICTQYAKYSIFLEKGFLKNYLGLPALVTNGMEKLDKM